METVAAVRSIASTPYDTAWVAAVPHPTERRDPRFPTALNWIAANQHADGSWGSSLPYVHDRFLCTLAALVPLNRFGRRESDRLQVRRGERYLWQNAHLLQRDPCELVGFELLLPTLARLAREAGVNIPPRLMDTFATERAQKLQMLPPHLIYSPKVTIAHSLEFLGAEVNPLQLLSVRAPNGSIGNSPAATAFLLHHADDAAAAGYLERCLAGDGGSAVPVLEPCEIYDALWTAYHRWLGGTPAAELLPEALREHLAAALAGNGVSLSPSFPVPDADETAVALLLFKEAGISAAPTALQQFERDDYFVSFPYERHASTGVNIHALQALLRYPDYPERERAIRKVLTFLEGARQQGSYWFDKWHISPYYATGRAVIALSELGQRGTPSSQQMVTAAVEWIVQTQHESGAWGFYGVPTPEESAYAILALRALRQPTAAARAAIQQGSAYLATRQHEPDPALWIDKCLYYPPSIVRAAIQSALSGGYHV